MTFEEIAEKLEVTTECLENAIHDYRVSYGNHFTHKNYCFHFYSGYSF